jgi:hypothetical protein
MISFCIYRSGMNVISTTALDKVSPCLESVLCEEVHSRRVDRREEQTIDDRSAWLANPIVDWPDISREKELIVSEWWMEDFAVGDQFERRFMSTIWLRRKRWTNLPDLVFIFQTIFHCTRKGTLRHIERLLVGDRSPRDIDEASRSKSSTIEEQSHLVDTEHSIESYHIHPWNQRSANRQIKEIKHKTER